MTDKRDFEQALADLHGMQDGAALRDERAWRERLEAELAAERDKVAALAAALARRVKLYSGPGSEDQADLRLLDEVSPGWREK